MAEGSVWEAVQHAAHYKLGNLICIVDVNRLGQRGETMLGWNTRAYAQQAQAFGWRTLEIDGHNLDEIDRAYAQAAGSSEAPTMIVARTINGKGVSLVENTDGWHGKALSREQAVQAVAEPGGERRVRGRGDRPRAREPAPSAARG